MRRIVFLHGLAEDDPETHARIVAFRQALDALGWKENRNIEIAHRFSAGDIGLIQTHTAEIVRSAPDLIVANSTPVLAALKQATRTIPIVFAVVNDPVGQGFVASLARPGGNITGFTYIEFALIGKWLELLKEIAPSVMRVTLVFNPQTAPYYPVFLRDFGSAARQLAELSETPVHDAAEVESAVTAFPREPGGGLTAPSVVILPGPNAIRSSRVKVNSKFVALTPTVLVAAALKVVVMIPSQSIPSARCDHCRR
jgi:putative tryptophan/tyrosine transport system substrate-binding protein